jgi:hypothetical protein
VNGVVHILKLKSRTRHVEFGREKGKKETGREGERYRREGRLKHTQRKREG